MYRTFPSITFAAVFTAAAFAGALTLEIGNPQANPEARKLNAVLVARVTACADPTKATVTASVVVAGKELRTTALQVIPLNEKGTFAIVGDVARDSVIELTATSPQYPADYRPRLLVRADGSGIHWASVRRFYSKPPTESDIRSILGQVD